MKGAALSIPMEREEAPGMYSEKPLLHERQSRHRPGTLRTLAVDVTPACNMQCSHCYAETFSKVEPVALDVLAATLGEACDMGVFHFVLQGGEPIVAPDRLAAIIGMCRPEQSYLNVVSNGWAMTAERIHWLRGLQVDKITYSLDSGLAAEHDAIRGEGSHERVLRAIDATMAEGLLTAISTVVTHTSLYSEGFSRAYDFAVGKGIRMHVQVAEPVGKWDGRKEALVRPADTAHLKRLEVQSPVVSTGQRMVHRDIFCGDRDHCPAGTEFMGITADGHVLPCNFLQFSLGRIGDRPLATMREDLLQSPWFDGEHPTCICGENDEFFDSFIAPHRGRPKPLDAYEIFGLPRTGHTRLP